MNSKMLKLAAMNRNSYKDRSDKGRYDREHYREHDEDMRRGSHYERYNEPYDYDRRTGRRKPKNENYSYSRNQRKGRREVADYDYGYDDDYDYDDDDEDYAHPKRMWGYGEIMVRGEDYKKEKPLTKKSAEEWVRHMTSEDGSHSKGGKWPSMDSVKPYAQALGIPTEGKEFVDFYAMMNAMYSDYSAVAKKYGADKPEFYASMAKAWMNDEDAVENKTDIYYNCIVMK